MVRDEAIDYVKDFPDKFPPEIRGLSTEVWENYRGEFIRQFILKYHIADGVPLDAIDDYRSLYINILHFDLVAGAIPREG